MSEVRPVLAVIDVQVGFVNERSAGAVPVIAKLLRRWCAAGGDVVVTRFINYPGSPYERLMGWTRLTDAPETDLVADVSDCLNNDTPVIDKSIYTLFTETGANVVRSKGWTDLYLCGIDTDNCVLKTAVDAFERNLTPWIIADASASTGGSPAHEAGLLLARRFIGGRQIITSECLPGEVLAGLPAGA